ncbi:MAG: DUF6515 family protein [Helicobacteraceae bacterium]|jgi:hypothetical protein|nr:DUF6515 family protein [Helicobacteraceae bacterium]
MRNTTMTIVLMTGLLSSATLCAEPGHSGNNDRSGQSKEMKRSSSLERSPAKSRSSGTSLHVSKPSREQTPKVRSNSDKTAVKSQHMLKQKEMTQYKQAAHIKASKPMKRTPAWRPPKGRPLPYYHRPGYTIGTLPTAAISVSLGSVSLYYTNGIYYRPYNNAFMVILPPIGLLVPVLPLGYLSFQVYGGTYYYYADVYYVWDVHHRAYRVVDVPATDETYPPGTIVDILPDGAYTVTIDGVQYYRYGGVYFMQSVQGERIVYIVVTP